jgi:uncharacterized protein involved in exopolysaccharide biosynthesis
VTTANGAILKTIIDKPAPEVEDAIRRLSNALERPESTSTATEGDLWPRPSKAAVAALADLRTHYTGVRNQIAKAPQILGDAPQKRQLLDALDAEIKALEQFETALFPRTGSSKSQANAFSAAKKSATAAGDKLSQALRGL